MAPVLLAVIWTYPLVYEAFEAQLCPGQEVASWASGFIPREFFWQIASHHHLILKHKNRGRLNKNVASNMNKHGFIPWAIGMVKRAKTGLDHQPAWHSEHGQEGGFLAGKTLTVVIMSSVLSSRQAGQTNHFNWSAAPKDFTNTSHCKHLSASERSKTWLQGGKLPAGASWVWGSPRSTVSGAACSLGPGLAQTQAGLAAGST